MVRETLGNAVCLAAGITGEGTREVLGLLIADNEGANFWLSVMNEFRNRGVQDILIAVVGGLKGIPDAINATFPQTYGAALHCSFGPSRADFVLLEGAHRGRCSPARGLQCRNRRDRPGRRSKLSIATGENGGEKVLHGSGGMSLMRTVSKLSSFALSADGGREQARSSRRVSW